VIEWLRTIAFWV